MFVSYSLALTNQLDTVTVPRVAETTLGAVVTRQSSGRLISQQDNEAWDQAGSYPATSSTMTRSTRALYYAAFLTWP